MSQDGENPLKIPRPPGFEVIGLEQPRNRIPRPKTIETVTPVDKKMSYDETSMLLDKYLLAEHREDPNVIRWIAHYMIHRNALQAAREAGLKPSAGHVLKNRPDIYNCIKALTDKAAMKHGFDAGEVIERVKEVMDIDPGDLYNSNGSFKHLKDMRPETQRAIKKFKAKNYYETDPNGMKVLAGEIIEIEFWDKMKATELLGREKDLFTEKKTIQHDIMSNMKEMLLGSLQRGQDHASLVRNVTPVALPEPVDIEVEDEE